MGDKKVTYDILRFAGGSLPNQYFNFVLATWITSYKNTNDFMRLVDSEAYFEAYSKYAIHLLYSPNITIRIAALTEDPDVTLGFSVVRDSVLHYVYVKQKFRHLGMAKLLVPIKIDTFTHLTKMGLQLWPIKLSKAKFNPFA